MKKTISPSNSLFSVNPSRNKTAKRSKSPRLKKSSLTASFAAGLGLSTVGLSLLATQSANAASATWTGATDAIWADANWGGVSPVPGAGDTATFSGTSANTTINLGTGVTIGTILFDTSSAAAYTTGTGAAGAQTLTLSNGGAITMTSTVAHNELFNAALVLGTDGSQQTFTLTNNSTTNGLTVAGGIIGSTGAGIKTLAVAGSGTTTLSGVIGNGTTGTVALTKSGTGTLTLSGVNTFTGGSTISAGVVSISADRNLGAAASAISLNGGTVQVTSGFTSSQVFTIGASGGTFNITSTQFNFTGANTLLGSGTLTVIGGNGTLTDGASFKGNLAFNNANLFTGSFVLQNGGNIEVNNQAAFGSGVPITVNANGEVILDSAIVLNNALTFNGGELTFNGSPASIAGNVTLNGTGATVRLAQFWTNSPATNPGLIAGCVSGTGGLTIQNFATTLTLTGSNSYTGATSIGTNATLINVTPNSRTYSAVISGGGAFTKSGTGTLILNGTNTYTGTTTVSGGLLQIGDGSIGSMVSTALTFGGAGAINYKEAAASSQSMGALTFSAGEGTVQSTYGGSSTSTLTFSSLAARTAGAAGNFVTSGGTNGVTNIVNLTGAAAGFIDKGIYFNGADFASMNAAGTYVRALAYGSDANAAAVNTITASNHVKLTSTPASRAGDTLLTLNLAGSGVGYTMSSGTLILSSGGLIKSGGGSVGTISGGTGISTGGATEFVVRTDTASDLLTISTPILATSTGGVTKTGAGTLTLSAGANAYTGATTVDAGTLTLSGTYTGGGAFTVKNTGTLNISGANNGTISVAPAAGGVATANITGNQTGNLTLGPGAGGLAIANLSGTITLANSNTLISGNSGLGTSILNIGPGAYISGGNQPIDAASNGFGVINMTGGTVIPGQYLVAGISNSGAVGIWNISGGAVQISSGNAGTLGAAANTTGVLNLTGSGTYNSTAVNATSGIFAGENGNGYINVSGSGALVLGGQTSSQGLIIGKNSGAFGVVNLGAVGAGGGTITTNIVQKTNGGATGIFNFHGGTLVSSTTPNAAFFTGLTSAYVYSEGGTINNNGQAITIGQALLAASGTGVSAIGTSGGTGFATAPYVQISGGGGTGATAVANIDGSGNLTGITVTNPGTGYTTAPVISLIGGNGILPTISSTLGANTSGGLTYIGSGTTTLTGASTYSGTTAVNAGTVAIGVANALGSSSPVNVNGGTLSLTTFNDTVGPVTLTSGGIAGGSGVLSSSSFALQSGSVSAILGGAGGALTKSTGSTVTLTGSSTYTGATSVTNGTLILSGSGSINGSSGIAINGSGAKLLQLSSAAVSPAVTLTQGTLDGTGTLNSVTVGDGTGGVIQNGNGALSALTIGTLSFNGAGTLTLATSSTTPVLVTTALNTGVVNTSGTVIVNATNTIWSNGTVYDLISYSGSIGGQGFANFAKGTIANLGARQVATLANPAGFVALNIAGDLPLWTGAQTGDWTTNTIGGASNWKLQTAGSATDFLINDTAVFDDSAVGTTAVNISTANVAPASTTFNNSTKNYTLSSTNGYGISGGLLIKSGTGVVTINTANTYGGGTTLNAGTLNLNNASAIGTGAFTITGGAIDNTSGSAITLTTNNVQNWNADFAFGGSGLLNLGTGAVTLGGSRTVTTSGTGVLTVGGPISGSGFGITKSGTGTLALGGSNSFTAGVTVNAGTLNINNASALGISAAFTISGGTIDNTSGGAITLTTNNTQNWAADFAFGGSNALNLGTGAVNIGATRTVTTNGSAALTEGGSIGDSGNIYGLIKAGSGTLVLAGSNTYTGPTTVNAGALQLGNANALRNSAVTVNSANGLAFSSGITTFNLGSLSGAANLVLSDTGGGAVTANVGLNGSAQTYSGNLSGLGGVTVSGSSFFTLSGSNSYTGLTTISSGTLKAGNAAAFGSGTIAITGASGAATLDINGQTISNALTNSFTGAVITNSAMTTGTISSGFNLSGTSGVVISDFTINGTGNIVWSGVIDRTSGGGTLTKAGSNTLFLSGTNPVAGMALVVNGGRLVYGRTNTGGDGTLTSGTLQMDPNFQVSSASSWSGVFPNGLTVNGGVWDLNDTGINGVSNRMKHLTGSGGIVTNSGTATGLLVIAVRDNVNATYAGNIQDGSNGGKVAVTIQQGGSWGYNQVFSGTNTYSGATTLWDDTIQAGSTTGLSPNSAFILSNSGGVLDLNNFNNTIGSLASTVTNSSVLTGTGAGGILTTGGNNTNTTFSGVISGSGGLTKTGTGTFTVSNTNTYYGPTTVNAGMLLLSGTLSNTSAVAVNGGVLQLTGALSGSTSTLAINGGGTLSGTGRIAGAVTVAGGASSATQGTINLVNGALTTLPIGGGLTLGGTAGPAILNLEVNASTADQLSLGSGALTVNSGGAAISITNLVALTAGESFNLLTYNNGSGAGFATGAGTVVGGLTLANPGLGFGVTGSLAVSNTAVQLVIGGAASPATAYWSGTQGSQWSNTNGGNTAGNFTTDLAATNFVVAYPGPTTDVFFSPNGATNLTNTLGQGFDVHSLTFQNGIGAVSIGGSNQLTVESGGVTVENGAGQVTVSANLALGTSQTWTNNSANPLTVSGAVSGTGSLTAGGGAILLQGSNSYSGGTTVAAGSLQIGNSASLGATTAPLAVNGGMLDLNGKSPTVGDFSGSTGAVVTTTASGTATLTVGGSSSTVYDGTLSDGGSGQLLRLVKSGSGSLALTGNNSYSGGTTINSGMLQVGSSGALGTGAVSIAATLDLNGQTIGNAFTNSPGSVITNSSASTATVTNGFNIAGTGGFTIADLTINGAGDIVWSGAFNRNNGQGTLTKAGSNTLFMSGTSVYSGMNLTVNGGRVVYGKTYSEVIGTLTINSGTMQMDPNYQVTSTPNGHIWDGAIAGQVAINGGVWDLNDTGGINNRSKHISGTGGVITNSGTGTALVIFANRDGTQTNTWAGSIQDGFNGGKVAVNFDDGGARSGTQVNVLSGYNTYSGATYINTDIVQAGATTAFSPYSAYTLTNNSDSSNSTLDLNNYSNTIGSLAGGGLVWTGTGMGGILTTGNDNTNTTYSGVISGNGGLTKTGAGTFILSGTSTYAGLTTVNSGTLTVTGALTGNGGGAVNSGGTLNLPGVALSGTGAWAINGGGTLVGSGTIGGPVTVTGGGSSADQGTINMINGAVGTLSFGGLTVGDSATGASLLNFDAGGGVSDRIVLGANSFTVNSGGAVVKINSLGAIAPGDVFTLITYSDGSAPTGVTLDPTTTQLGFNTGSLILSASALQLSITGPATPTTAWFTGAYSSTWNGSDGGTNANFTADSAGTINTKQIPGVTTNVYLAGDSAAATASVLGENFSIASLTFSGSGPSATYGCSVSGSNTLTVGSGGITVNSGNAGATISTSRLVLGASQTWTNNSSTLLTVSANVSGSGALTVAGGGGLLLSNSNSYTGGTTLTGGTLQLGNNAALGAVTGALTIIAGTVDLAGNSPTVGAFSGSSTATVTNNSSGIATLTVGDSNSTTFAGTLADGYGRLALTKAGSGTLVLSSSNTYSGSTSVNGGTLQLGAAGALGSGSLAISAGATLDLNGIGMTNSISAVSGTLTNSSGTPVVYGKGFNNGGRTCAVGGVGDITLNTVTGNAGLSINKFGSDTLTLTGSSDDSYLTVNLNGGKVVLNLASATYVHALGGSGTSTIVSGTLQLAGTGNDQIWDGHSIAVNGGVFDMNGRSETILALSGSSGGGLTNSALTSSTLTLTSGATFGGSIQNGAGTISLSMILGTAGTQVFSGSNNYSGTTALYSGTLVLANSNALQNTALTVYQSAQQIVFDSSVSSHAFAIGSIANNAGCYLTLADNAATPNPVTLTVGGNNGSTTFSGNLLGVGSLIKTGTGTLTLSGANLYSGSTTISAGTLATSGTASLPGYNLPGQVSVASGATLTLAVGTGKWQAADVSTLLANASFATNSNLGIDTTAGSVTYSSTNVAINGAIGLQKLGSNILGITGSNNYSGGTQIKAGTLGVGGSPNANSYGLGTGDITVYSGGTLRPGYLVTSNTNVATIANNINLAGGTIYVDDAFQHLSGTVSVTAASTLGSTYNGGSNSAGERDKGLFLDGVVSGTSALTLQQSGIQTGQPYDTSIVHFANNGNSYSGTITVIPMTSAIGGGSYVGVSATGALQFAGIVLNGNNTNSQFGTSPIVFKSGLGSVTLGSISGSGRVVLTGYDEINHGYGTDAVALTVGGNNTSTTLSGVVSGSGSLAKTGTGTFTLSGSNSYMGGTRVNNGTLKVGSANALGTGGLAMNGGTLDLNGLSVSVPVLSGSAGALITNTYGGSVSLTDTAASGTATYAGAISDGAGSTTLVKSGSGALVLSGSIQMAGLGATAGSVTLEQSAAIGSMTVAAGASVGVSANTDGNRKILNLTSLSIAGFDAGIASVSSSLPASALNSDSLGGGATYAALDAAGQRSSGATAQAAEPAAPEAVPEPGAMGLLLAGVAGLLARRSRSKRN